MRRLRVLLQVHNTLVPPESAKKEVVDDAEWKTEYDVRNELRNFGHDVQVIGIDSDVDPLRGCLHDFKPHVVFNLLEEFDGNATYDHNIVSYLELRHHAYTGCNPRGLMLARDKALSKKVLSYHRIPTPKFQIIPKGHRIKLASHLKYPVFVKSLIEEASLGISQASVVNNDKQLTERVGYIFEKIQTDALVESYIEGREFYVGVWGNRRIEALPVWELKLNKLKESGAKPIATSQVKWSLKYRKKHKIHSAEAKIDPELKTRLQDIAKRCYKRLGLSGYARIDLRMTDDGRVYVLEANPNPGIARDEEFVFAASSTGLKYEEILNKILRMGMSWFEKRS